jgi:class 3 adenylate cyclase
VDLAAYEEAGLYDPADPAATERAELLAFLEEQGCSLEEMTAAHANGRLFALAGDRVIRPERNQFTLAEVAAAIGADEDAVRRAWRAYGLTLRDPGEKVASPDDVQALRTHFAFVGFFGDNAGTALARVVASSMARVGEALSTTVRSSESLLDIGITGSEPVTARAFADAARLVPHAGRLLDTMFRHHLESARSLFEQAVELDPNRQIALAVGFIDLCDYTALAGRLESPELAHLLTRFEEIATEVASDAGARVVKFLGDAAMFVAPDPTTLLHTVCGLMTHPDSKASGLSARGGLAYGRVIAQDGDFFGPPVNLASRLVSAAEPNTVLLAPGIAERVGANWPLETSEGLALRGIEGPVTAHVLRTFSGVPTAAATATSTETPTATP